MPSAIVPFAALLTDLAAYRAAVAEGWPPGGCGHGVRSALGVTAKARKMNARTLRSRLMMARTLGLDAPGIAPLADAEAAQLRRRYHQDSAEYRAWLADPGGDGPAEARRASRMGEVSSPSIPETARPPAGFFVSRNAVQIGPEGEVERQWIGTKRDAGEVHAPIPGHVVKGESALLDADGRVMQRWVKTREGAVGEGLVEALQAAFREFRGAAPLAPPPPSVAEHLHVVYPLADLHLGLYSWGRETGEDYDVSIAVRRATAAYRALICQAPPAATCTLLGLGDFFHQNDETAATPRSGHRLDVDGRWPRVLRAGCGLMLDLVGMLAQRHASVEVVVLPGNHDPDASVALRQALGMYYARDASPVTVDDGPGLFWYRRHGRCLLGATHGHTARPERLPGIMAADRPEDWGQTDFRVWLTGHVHHERAREDAGVRVEAFGTLASRDAYATGGGWRAGRAVQAIAYHDALGEVGRSRVNLVVGPDRVRRQVA